MQDSQHIFYRESVSGVLKFGTAPLIQETTDVWRVLKELPDPALSNYQYARIFSHYELRYNVVELRVSYTQFSRNIINI